MARFSPEEGRRSGTCAKRECRSSASPSIWAGRTPHCESSSPMPAEPARRARERSELRLSLQSERRSRGGWRPVIPSVPSPRPWAARPRRCVGRSTPTAGGGSTGPWWPTGRRVGGRCDPSGPSSPSAGGFEGWSSASSRPSGHPSRSRRGWLWSTPIARRCRCPTRPSTSHCSSRAVERCAKSSIRACAAVGPCAGPRPTPRATSARASSATW